MSDLGDIIGSAASSASPTGMIGNIAKLGDDIFNSIWPSPEAKATAEATAAKASIDAYVAKAQSDFAPMLAQIEVDKAEASNASMFVAGWRPFIGWVCGAGFAYTFVLEPLGSFAASLAGWNGAAPPTLDTSSLMSLTLGMLGMGALHVYGQTQGVEATNVLASKVKK